MRFVKWALTSMRSSIGGRFAQCWDHGCACIPAIHHLSAYIFEEGVAHVLHAEDVEVGIVGNAVADIGVELNGKLLALFRRLGQVHDFCALGFRHVEELSIVVLE